MLKKDLMMRNPLRAVSDENGYILPEGGLGCSCSPGRSWLKLPYWYNSP